MFGLDPNFVQLMLRKVFFPLEDTNVPSKSEIVHALATASLCFMALLQ